jgi:hypothetical protein
LLNFTRLLFFSSTGFGIEKNQSNTTGDEKIFFYFLALPIPIKNIFPTNVLKLWNFCKI